MARDADLTRQRLLAAATDEFSELGLAGARVDRIAARAGCNKALIYSYFGGKEQLLGAVVQDLFVTTVAEVPLTTDDLPGYVAALFDRYAAHPEMLRLISWQRLEGAVGPATEDHDLDKVEAIDAAQRAGGVRADIPAAELLTLLIGMSVAAALGAPGLDLNRLAPEARQTHRTALRIAALRLVTPDRP